MSVSKLILQTASDLCDDVSLRIKIAGLQDYQAEVFECLIAAMSADRKLVEEQEAAFFIEEESQVIGRDGSYTASVSTPST